MIHSAVVPLGRWWTLAGSPQIAPMWAADPSLGVVIASALEYSLRSSASSAAIVRAPRSSPTATAAAGQRSRTSSTQGTRWRAATAIPAAPTGSGGDDA